MAEDETFFYTELTDLELKKVPIICVEKSSWLSLRGDHIKLNLNRKELSQPKQSLNLSR